MNKFMTFLIAFVVTLVVGFILIEPANAGLWDSMATSNMPTQDSEHRYKVETYGYNVRVYEWTPKDNKNVRCVFVAGSENSSGVACYEVEKSKEK